MGSVRQKKPPRCIAAGGGSVLIAQGVCPRVSLFYWLEAEDWPEIEDLGHTTFGVPPIAEEVPTVPAIALRSRPIGARYGRAADICGDVGIHGSIVGITIFVVFCRAEVLEYRLVVALLRHAPVRHGGAAQRGVARQAAKCTGGQLLQRGAGVGQ